MSNRPTELSIDAQFAEFRRQLQAEGRCGPRKPAPPPETREQKYQRYLRGEIPAEALYPARDDEMEV